MSPMLYIIIALTFLVIVIALSGIRQISQSQCAIIERLGRYHKTLNAGLNFIMPFLDKIRFVGNVNLKGTEEGISPYRIDLREQILDIPKQSVITKDNVEMDVDTLIFYQVIEPHRIVYEISSPVEAIRQLSRTTIRNIIGGMELDASLSARGVINERLRTILDEATDKWGVKIMRVEIQDISPPPELKVIMQKQMIAERDRRAKVTLAEAEKQSTILEAESKRQDVILRAEGQNKAIILKAEAEKQNRILTAEGEAEAIRLVQQATAAGLDVVRGVLGQTGGTQGLIILEALKAQMEIAKNLSSGESTKLFLPTDIAGFYGAIGGIKEILKATSDSTMKP
jgi:regulator of protease activity HflC (stomatin/prohibitin superfamily)